MQAGRFPRMRPAAGGRATAKGSSVTPVSSVPPDDGRDARPTLLATVKKLRRYARRPQHRAPEYIAGASCGYGAAMNKLDWFAVL